MTTIVGYVYDADIHCTPCAKKRHGNQEADDADANGIPLSATDTEGNAVGPVFDGQESDSPQNCRDCKEPIEGITVLGRGSRA